MTLVRFPRARYDAGQSNPHRADPPYSRGPDAEQSVSGVRLRNWARHLSDNSSIVRSILSSRVANAIGTGLTYEPLVRDRRGRLIPELNDALRRIHARWSRSVDTAGELSRPEMERVVWRTWDRDGEAFTRRVVRRRPGEGNRYQLQVLNNEWIPWHLTQQKDGERIIQGLVKSEWNETLAAYVQPDTLDSTTYPMLALDPGRMIRIAAADLHHLKHTPYANQTRGTTILHAVIFRIFDIAEFAESHRLAARASSDLFASINRSPDVSNPGKLERDWHFERLQILDELQAGESVNFHTPQHPNQNAVDFIREELRAIAAGTDVGFSQIAQVFDSSYAAQRLEVVDTWRKVERDRSKFVNDFARPALYERVIEAARLAGDLPARLLRRADPETLLDVRIDGPVMPVIDPVKDRQAFALDQDHRWDSRPGIIRRMGRTPQDVDAEIQGDLFQREEPEPEGE